MARDWVEPNPDHPRDPHTGEFIDRPGIGTPGDWAQRISDSMRPGADPSHVQTQRENVLDALNPRTALLRESNKLFKELGIGVSADSAVESYLSGANFPIPIPIPDDFLDQVLFQHLEYDTPLGDIAKMRDRVEAWQNRTGRFLPESSDLLDELLQLPQEG